MSFLKPFPFISSTWEEPFPRTTPRVSILTTNQREIKQWLDADQAPVPEDRSILFNLLLTLMMKGSEGKAFDDISTHPHGIKFLLAACSIETIYWLAYGLFSNLIDPTSNQSSLLRCIASLYFKSWADRHYPRLNITSTAGVEKERGRNKNNKNRKGKEKEKENQGRKNWNKFPSRVAE